MSKQKVFIPVPVSERLPDTIKVTFWISKSDHLRTGSFMRDTVGERKFDRVLYGNGTSAVENFVYWLEERELHVLTDEELQAIIRDAKLAETFSMPAEHKEITHQLNIDKS